MKNNLATKTLLALSALCLAFAGKAQASAYGTLSNFDVVNDSGHDCHGFEIELEDLHPSDVPYFFGGPYIRYGDPQVIDATVPPGPPVVIVRYRHWNGSAWEATPMAPSGVSPSGHDCYSGGPIGNYLTSGCEHYGVSLQRNPTRTTYRWLVASEPSNANSPFSTAPETAGVPVPAWNVAPAVGGGGNAAVGVGAEVEPLEEEMHVQKGEPQWLCVYKIKSDRELHPEDLDKLLLGLADGLVPAGETEIESEWKLIQSSPGDAEGEEEDADVRDDVIENGDRSVIRRYEFYRYGGPRDPENIEAFPCDPDEVPVPEAEPVNGCSDLGSFVGAQNVALDAGLSLTNGLPNGFVGIDYTERPIVLGGLPPYAVEITGGALPDGLLIDAATAVLSGTPEAHGTFELNLRVSDSLTAITTGVVSVTVGGDSCLEDPDKTKPGACGCGIADVDIDNDLVADCIDQCPLDATKAEPGACGCAVADIDGNGNGVIDCLEVSGADLSASVTQSTRIPRAGRRIRFTLRADNAGPDLATSATLETTITGGAYRDLRMTRGCSLVGETIVCTTNKIAPRRNARKRFSVVADAGTTLTVTTTASGPLSDPDSSNQTDAVTTIIP